jgi:hypothetical protein
MMQCERESIVVVASVRWAAELLQMVACQLQVIGITIGQKYINATHLIHT